MKMNHTLSVTLLLLLIVVVVRSEDTDSKVKEAQDNGVGPKIQLKSKQHNSLNEKAGELDSDLGSKKVVPLKKGKDQVGELKGVRKAGINKNKPDKQLVNKEDENVQTDANGSKSVKDGDKKGDADKGSGSKIVLNEKDTLPSTTKESIRGEECDSSFKCTDHSNAFVACLRVPGNESPGFSLLIQNKRKGPLIVDITAPDFVHLEKTKVELHEKENEKVMVSIGSEKTEKFIVLKTKDGNCSLDFRDFITHNPMKKSDYKSQLTYTNLFRRAPFLGLIFLAALLVVASILMYLSFQRRRFRSNGSKYQKLDMEIPVSDGAKMDLDLKDGWDESWSDGWDDVEAPTTPSMPVTPSLSSQGVASRRVNKERWKD